jgi:hypothetical protein
MHIPITSCNIIFRIFIVTPYATIILCGHGILVKSHLLIYMHMPFYVYWQQFDHSHFQLKTSHILYHRPNVYSTHQQPSWPFPATLVFLDICFMYTFASFSFEWQSLLKYSFLVPQEIRIIWSLPLPLHKKSESIDYSHLFPLLPLVDNHAHPSRNMLQGELEVYKYKQMQPCMLQGTHKFSQTLDL